MISPAAKPRLRQVHYLLRLGVAACFIGHGAFGILQKEDWLPFFALIGIGPEPAFALMPFIGAADITVGILALVLPFRALFVYATVWCVWTAALRPLTGLGIWEMVERAGNYGVPLAMLTLIGLGDRGRSLLVRIDTAELIPNGFDRAFHVLKWTTALLLIGHGMLALGGKPLLVSHLASVGVRPVGLPLLGVIEIVLAVAVLARPHPLMFGYIALWKLMTELMFIAAGSPFWEVVERGGSYMAPLVAAMLWFHIDRSARTADSKMIPSGGTWRPGTPRVPADVAAIGGAGIDREQSLS